ncbi:hypothetical protein ZHAS_00002387 [Anopheles sinensis]|uniref:Uncharacterized protein n=1 Tax=Anopheles sinensis TaxID=74873 RepID=A0A084VC52_ANOSI|nr:hypothetical protein ZHAS_00002387 [Anopheles sinensis]
MWIVGVDKRRDLSFLSVPLSASRPVGTHSSFVIDKCNEMQFFVRLQQRFRSRAVLGIASFSRHLEAAALDDRKTTFILDSSYAVTLAIKLEAKNYPYKAPFCAFPSEGKLNLQRANHVRKLRRFAGAWRVNICLVLNLVAGHKLAVSGSPETAVLTRPGTLIRFAPERASQANASVV